MKYLFKHDAGQATTEYILLLMAVVGFVTFMVKTLLKPAFLQLENAAKSALQNVIFGGNLHYFHP